jgi:hypothetical protein
MIVCSLAPRSASCVPTEGEALEAGVRAEAVEAEQQPAPHLVAVGRLARGGRREGGGEADAQVRLLDDVEQPRHRPAPAELGLERLEVRRLGLGLKRADQDGMPPARVEAHARVARQPAVELRQCIGHLRPQRVGEGPRLGGQVEPRVAGRAARGEVGRQVLVRVAEAVGPDHPDLLAAQPVAERLQDADLVVDAVHPLPAARRVLQHDVAPLRADHALNRDLVGAEILPSRALGAADRRQRVEHRAVRAVVGAEVERGEEPRHHAAVVGAVGGAHRAVHPPAVRDAERAGLARQRLQRPLAGGGEDDVAHDALRRPDRGLGDTEQDAGLAAHLHRLVHQLLQHAALRLDGDAVRDADQQLDETVDHLRLARDAPEGQQRQADALRVPAQFPGGLDDGAAPEAPDQVGVQAAEQVPRQAEGAQTLQLVDLGKQALQPDPAWVGGQGCKRGARPVIGQQRVQALAGAGVEAVGHVTQGRVVMGGARRAQDAVEPPGTGSADPLAGEPAADLPLQRRRRRLARQQLLRQPAAEPRLGRVIEDGHREVVEDQPAVPPAGPARPVVGLQGIGIDAEFGRKAPDRGRRQVRLVVGKAAMGTPMGELRRQAEPA